jgi:hypothetical protein
MRVCLCATWAPGIEMRLNCRSRRAIVSVLAVHEGSKRLERTLIRTTTRHYHHITNHCHIFTLSNPLQIPNQISTTMSDYNNDIDMDEIENDFPDPLPTESHEQTVLLCLIWGLRRIAHDIYDKLEVHGLFKEVWDEEDRAEVGVRVWMVTVLDVVIDRLVERYQQGSDKKL